MIRHQRRAAGPAVFVALALSLALPGGPVGAASSPRDAAAEAQVQAREAQLATALAGADAERIGDLWAEDFASTMTDGRVSSREQRLNSVRRQPSGGGLTTRNERVDVRVYGDSAVALVTSVWMSGGQTVGDPYQATHVWTRQGGVWRLVAAHISVVTPKAPAKP